MDSATLRAHFEKFTNLTPPEKMDSPNVLALCCFCENVPLCTDSSSSTYSRYAWIIYVAVIIITHPTHHPRITAGSSLRLTSWDNILNPIVKTQQLKLSANLISHRRVIQYHVTKVSNKKRHSQLDLNAWNVRSKFSQIQTSSNKLLNTPGRGEIEQNDFLTKYQLSTDRSHFHLNINWSDLITSCW